MNIRKLKGHIAELQYHLQENSQNFWQNFGLLSFANFMWVTILPTLIMFQPYFRTDKWEDFARWGVLLVVFMLILAILGAHGESFKPTAGDGTLIVIFLLWLGFVGLVRADDPTAPPARNFEETVLYATLWEYKTTLVWVSALWMEAVFWHRLYFVHQNRNAKLSYLYIVFGVSLGIITTAYLMFAPLGFVVSLILPQKICGAWLESRSKKPFTERGTVIEGIDNGDNQQDEKREAQQSLRKEPDLTVDFGGIPIPLRNLVLGGMFFIGAVGVGKTLLIRLVMQAILPHIHSASDKRALVLNASRDNVSIVSGMTGSRVAIVDITDARCAKFAFCKSITSDAHVGNFAEIMFSPVGEGQKTEQFFRDAAIQLVTGITLYLIKHAPQNWELRDILLMAESLVRLRAILGSDSDTRPYLDVLATEKTADNVFASVKVELNKYRVPAALFYHAPNEISMDEWMAGGIIMVLGYDDRYASVMSVINRLILKHAMDEILATDPEIRELRTTFLLDEFQLLQLNSLRSFLTRARKRGVAVILGTQSINALYSEIGKHNTETILGMIAHQAFLPTNETDTLEWMSQKIGNGVLNQLNAQYGHEADFGGFLGHPTIQGYVENRTIINAVMASEISNLPRIDPRRGQGITGFFKTSRVWKHYYPWAEIKAKLIPPSDEPDYIPVEDAKQRLPQWTEADWIRLGIYDVMKKLEKEEKQGKSHIYPEEMTSQKEFNEEAAQSRLEYIHMMLRQANGMDDDEITITGSGTTPIQEQQPSTYRQTNPDALKRREFKKNNKQQPKNQQKPERGFNP